MLVNSKPRTIVNKSNNNQRLQQKNNIAFSRNFDNASDNKVSVKKGVMLVTRGIIGRTKDLAISVALHPFRTIGLAAVGSIAIASLPLIGITSSAGVTGLAFGLGALAVGKTAKDFVNLCDHSSNNEHYEFKKDLKNLGRDAVNLVTTLYFIPKGINAVKNYKKSLPGMPKPLKSIYTGVRKVITRGK